MKSMIRDIGQQYAATISAGEGGTGESTVLYTSSAEAQTKTIVLPTRAGYSITSWAFSGYVGDAPSISDTTLTIPANTFGYFTATPTWRALSYTATISDGGSGSGTSTVTYDTSAQEQTKDIVLPSKSGYSISAWSFDGYEGAPPSISGAKLTIPSGTAGNFIATPTWAVPIYTATISAGDGGTGGSTVSYSASTEVQTKEITLPSKVGCSISAWTFSGYIGDAPSISGQTLTIPANTTGSFTAIPAWVEITYTVTYKPGASSSGEEYSATKYYGRDLELRGETYTRSGYVQDGWSISDGGEKDYELNDNYTENANIVLYPHWVLSYTISILNESGGEVVCQVSYSVSTKSQTKTIVLPTKTGYYISEWTFSPIVDPTPYIFETTLTIPGNTSGNFDATPTWKQKPEVNLHYIDIDGNGETNTSVRTRYVTVAYGEKYPAISVLPQKTAFTLEGIYLIARKNSDGTDKEVCQCYDGTGNILASATQSQLTDSGYTCRLKANWTVNAIDTLDDLRNAIPIVPTPFGSVPSVYTEIPDKKTDKIEINYDTGFTNAFSTTVDKNGQVVTRRMMSTLGNIGSQCQFFEQCGGYYTFDEEFCSKIGGYPKNAILQFYDAENNQLRSVISLIDDNKVNFVDDGVDGISWDYCDNNPEVSIKVDYSQGTDISSSILVESGIPDLYEVPYDSFFQLFALSYLDCSSMKRNQIEDVKQAISKDEYGDYVYANVNGMYYTLGKGLTYLDIYKADTDAFGSVTVGGQFPFEWFLFWPKTEDSWQHAEKICPVSPLTCGVMLSKGDKIRLRNSFIDKLPDGFPASSSTCNAADVVKERLFTDDVLKRKYVVKSALLFPRGVTL